MHGNEIQKISKYITRHSPGIRSNSTEYMISENFEKIMVPQSFTSKHHIINLKSIVKQLFWFIDFWRTFYVQPSLTILFILVVFENKRTIIMKFSKCINSLQMALHNCLNYYLYLLSFLLLLRSNISKYHYLVKHEG